MKLPHVAFPRVLGAAFLALTLTRCVHHDDHGAEPDAAGEDDEDAGDTPDGDGSCADPGCDDAPDSAVGTPDGAVEPPDASAGALHYALGDGPAVGVPFALSPEAKPDGAEFRVEPALPPGLALDPTSGAITGTPERAQAGVGYTVYADSADGSVSDALVLEVAPARLTVRADALDLDGDALAYAWKASTGTLDRTDGPEVRWQLPRGRGLHFLYVLVSDGKGGYLERRVAVSTDALSEPAFADGVDPVPSAPAAASVPGGIFRSWLGIEYVPGLDQSRVFYTPGVRVYLGDPPTAQQPVAPPRSPIVTSNVFGEFVIPKLPVSAYEIYCARSGGDGFEVCRQTARSGGINPVLAPRAVTNYRYADATPTGTVAGIAGQVRLADGTPCGTLNPYFGKEVTGTAELLDQDSAVLQGPIAINAYGDYAFPLSDATARPYKVRVTCEGAPPVVQVVTTAATSTLTASNFSLPNHAPTLSALTASLGARVVAGGPIAPAALSLPSDALPESFRFLTTKGIDDAVGACAYYRAIGAVTRCDPDGGLRGAITFDQWKKAHHMAPYATGTEHTATYVNAVDLNLTRRHHGVQTGPDDLAFYVCNHLGPRDDSQAAVDEAIAHARNDENLVACVAMDYGVTPGVNGDRPFIKFHIFDARGQLTSSVNLDGRGEKFVPGTCVACHGGDHYAGKYPSDGTGVADVGAHYLPYDLDNFRFSSEPELLATAQHAELKALNQLLLAANPSDSVAALVRGWYPDGRDVPDESYVPPTWSAAGTTAVNVYQKMVKPTCRTCHVAFEQRFDFDLNFEDTFSGLPTTVGSPVCGGSNEGERKRAHTMPNSKVTFDRLWLRLGASDDPFPEFEQVVDDGPEVMCVAPSADGGW